MRAAGKMVGLFMVVGLINGCASPQTTQTITRLQASIDLLDQRVNQLERMGTRETADQSLMGRSSEALAAIAPTQPSLSTAATTTTRSWTKPSTREIQQALKNAGFYQGAIDGKMGPQSREAIREFQRVHGLSVDGIVGRKTWAQLSPYQDLSASSGELVAAETLK